MDDDAFWALIEDLRGRPGDRDERLEWLRAELIRRPVADCVGFQARLERACDAVYTRELWAAAARILGGRCSDDGFHYFRLWLVSQGRKIYETALGDPDSLADAPGVLRLVGRPLADWCETEEWPDWECLDYVAQEAYDVLTRQPDDEGAAFLDAVEAEYGDAPDPGEQPSGRSPHTRDRDDVARDIPRLAALFPPSLPS